jgi:hypothetical protein
MTNQGSEAGFATVRLDLRSGKLDGCVDSVMLTVIVQLALFSIGKVDA